MQAINENEKQDVLPIDSKANKESKTNYYRTPISRREFFGITNKVARGVAASLALAELSFDFFSPGVLEADDIPGIDKAKKFFCFLSLVTNVFVRNTINS